MEQSRKPKHIDEFGDFQTPMPLAKEVCRLLIRRKVRPRSIIEPTCGKGSFLLAALDSFPNAETALALDINQAYLDKVRADLRSHAAKSKVKLGHADFFQTDWPKLISSLREPLLVIGNPPWVTNAVLGSIGSGNLPKKSNFQGHKGFDAITGKSNFDISEWMLIRLLEWLSGREATLAMLCKSSVGRKVLHHAWRHSLMLRRSEIHLIDAHRHFGAAVDAAMLLCRLKRSASSKDCFMYPKLCAARTTHMIGFRDSHLVADMTMYEKWKHLLGDEYYRWRSGIKHDCSKVMELRGNLRKLNNGLGEKVSIEGDYLYPMLKSSDVANSTVQAPTRWMIVTQTKVGEETSGIQSKAPATWKYLNSHAQQLDKRASSIYRNRPQFSIFGVGAYSFSRWKVAISGLYRRLDFKVIGEHDSKPIVLDDTINFIACASKREAEFLYEMLNSVEAKEFFSAFVFWDTKRPITIELLRRLDLLKLSRELHWEGQFVGYLSANPHQKKELTPSVAQQTEIFT